MQPKIKMGLAVGAIGLVLKVCIAGLMGICGPLVSLRTNNHQPIYPDLEYKKEQ